MTYRFIPQFAVKPGATLKETLSSFGMTQAELALRCGLSGKAITEIINGECAFTVDTALKIEKVLGIEASFWISLEKKYRENKARLEQLESVEHEKNLASAFSVYAEMVKFGLVKKTSDLLEKAEELLRYFGVNSLETVNITEAVAFKISTKRAVSKESLAAWLRWGEKGSLEIDVPSEREPLKKSALNTLKKYVFTDPKDSYEEVKEICKNMGIAYIYLPYFEKTYISGATRWIGDKAIVQLSPLYTYRDSFWFAFFHELGHVYLHGRKETFIEIQDPLHSDERKILEDQANSFACDTLINKTEYKKFVAKQNFSDAHMKSFAEKNDIPVDLVAGRLAFDRVLTWPRVSHLRKHLKPIS